MNSCDRASSAFLSAAIFLRGLSRALCVSRVAGAPLQLKNFQAYPLCSIPLTNLGGLLLLDRYQYPVQPMEGVPLPLPPGIPGLGGSTDPLEAVLGPFPCARLRNLPFSVELEDILHLFQGLVVIDVVLLGHGEAFVIFANPMDYQMALQR